MCLLLGPAAVFVLTLMPYFGKDNSITVLLIALVQFLSLAYFAVVRQIGQKAGTALFAEVAQLRVAVQWDTLIVFLSGILCFRCPDYHWDAPATCAYGAVTASPSSTVVNANTT